MIIFPGELIFEVRESKKRVRADLRAAETWLRALLNLDRAASVARCLAAFKSVCFLRMSLSNSEVR